MNLFTAAGFGAACAMPVSASYRDYVLGQLAQLAQLSSRAMFGGYVVYSRGIPFAIIDDDRLFFHTTDETRAHYVDAGMQAWDPYGDGRTKSKKYAVPEAVIEDAAELRKWAELAVRGAGQGKKKTRKPPKKITRVDKAKLQKKKGNAKRRTRK